MEIFLNASTTLNFLFALLAAGMLAHAVVNRWHWRVPNKLYPWGVDKQGHRDVMLLLEFEMIAAAFGLYLALFTESWALDVMEFAIVTIVSLMIAMYAVIRLWRRPTFNREKFVNLLLAPVVLGVVVSIPALVRVGRQVLSNAIN